MEKFKENKEIEKNINEVLELIEKDWLKLAIREMIF